MATVNAELRVGALTETITVSGESPIVDVQSSQAVRTIDNGLIAAIPSSRGYQSFTVLQPGSTSRAPTSAARPARSSACFKPTAAGATRVRCRSMA